MRLDDPSEISTGRTTCAEFLDDAAFAFADFLRFFSVFFISIKVSPSSSISDTFVPSFSLPSGCAFTLLTTTLFFFLSNTPMFQVQRLHLMRLDNHVLQISHEKEQCP
ncbi:unnamed protein product [Cuscuta epithymum]|uniref:Uncharacterized protein n=1 Tax=Cuscuta epithymum TaxID=186058 RepID=A0AAV0FRP5_9ASTE|nr:unnamed protein product [Cuscuta epithymum]